MALTIDEKLPADLPNVSTQDIQQWIATCAGAVSNYYGRFPVKYLSLVVIGSNRGRVFGGTEFSGERIRIHLGRDVRPSDLAKDWELTHEMFHLGFPEVDEDYHYMEEGLSDYLEPLAQARVGNLSESKVWFGFVDGMPAGQPQAGDQGLDHTHTWGRVYWGGAIFWMVADLRIREQTKNKKSLDDAIRTILNAGGDGAHHWPLERVIQTADRATGTNVLRDLHAELGEKPTRVDLDEIWRRLGITLRGNTVIFNDRAALAAIRRSMTAISSAPPSRPTGSARP